jgi:hypothetical protein
MDRVLTARQAYLVMFEFLRRHYERGPTDEIGGLLGSLSLLPDGKPADLAAEADFAEALAAVLDGEAQPGEYQKAALRLNDEGTH